MWIVCHIGDGRRWNHTIYLVWLIVLQYSCRKSHSRSWSRLAVVFLFRNLLSINSCKSYLCQNVGQAQMVIVYDDRYSFVKRYRVSRRLSANSKPKKVGRCLK